VTRLDKSRKMDKVVDSLLVAVGTFRTIPVSPEQEAFLTALRDVLQQGTNLAAQYYAETFPAGTLEPIPVTEETKALIANAVLARESDLVGVSA